MATVIHELITGGVIEYESSAGLEAFLPRVLKLLKDPTKTEDDMIEIVYGPENPIMGVRSIGQQVVGNCPR